MVESTGNSEVNLLSPVPTNLRNAVFRAIPGGALSPASKCLDRVAERVGFELAISFSKEHSKTAEKHPIPTPHSYCRGYANSLPSRYIFASRYGPVSKGQDGGTPLESW